MCVNSDCPIFKRVSHLNNVPKTDKSDKKCFHCPKDTEYEMVHDKCSSKRWIISSQDSSLVICYYQQNHTCSEQSYVLDQAVIDDYKRMFEQNSKLSAAQAFKMLFENKLKKIEHDAPIEVKRSQIKDLMKVVHVAIQDHGINNIKSNVVKAKTPHGSGIEAVLEIKKMLIEHYDELGVILEVALDTFVCLGCKRFEYSVLVGQELDSICESCGNEMVGKGPLVVLTSNEQIKNAYDMSHVQGVFEKSTAFCDHQTSRAESMTTFNVAFYDWQVRQMSMLFMAHCQSEDQLAVFASFSLFQELMKDYLGNKKVFKPYGFCTDNAGGILCGLKLFFGNSLIVRTCKFHFQYSCYQVMCNAIGGNSDKIIFLRYAFSLMDAPNASQFESYAAEMEKWMKQSKAREKALENWYKFWYNSRALWSNAYANPNLTETNQIEAIQSKYSKKNGLKNLSLEQSVIFGVADALLYQSRLHEAARGRYVGHGPTKHTLENRETQKMLNRVKNTAFTEEDLKIVMENLGLPNLDATEDEEIDEDLQDEETNFKSPIVNEIIKRKKVFENYASSPETTSVFKGTKSPKKKNVANSDIQNSTPKKPGRPKGAKSRINFSPYMKAFEIDDIFEVTENENPSIPSSNIEEVVENVQHSTKQSKAQKQRSIKNCQTASKNHFETMKKRAHEEIKNYDIENVYHNTFKITKLNISTARTSARVANRYQNHYLVEFGETAVTCSCLAYLDIISKMQDKVCKHIAMVLIMCQNDKMASYDGKRMITKNDYDILMEILRTHPGRNPQLDNDVSNPILKRPATRCNRSAFSNFDAAINAAEENEWWVEVYTSNGGPKCRTCGVQIKNNSLCITTDVVGTRPDPSRKTRKLYLAINTFRFCLNNYCALNVPPHQKKMKRFCPMRELSCLYIDQKYFADIVRLFVSSNVNIINK